MSKIGLKVLAGLTLILCAAYAILGTLVVPYVIERNLQTLFSWQPGQQLSVGVIHFNPFTFLARLEAVRLNRGDGSGVFTVDNLQLDFSIASLFQQRIVLSEVSLDKPRFSVKMSGIQDHRLDHGLTPVIDALSQVEGSAEDRPAIHIVRAFVHQGSMHITGRPRHVTAPSAAGAPPEAFELRLSDITLEIGNLVSDSVKPADFVLSMTINETATLQGDGRLLPATRAVSAAVHLTALDLASISPLVSTTGGPVHLSGVMSADGQLKLGDSGPHFEGDLAVSRLAISESPDDKPRFAADVLTVRSADIAAGPLRASAESVALNRPEIQLEVDTDGNLNLSHWIVSAFGPPAPCPGNKTDNRAWPPTIDELAIRDGFINFNDPRYSRPVRIEFGDVAGDVTSRTADPLNAVTMEFSGTMHESSSVALGGVVRFPDGQPPESAGKIVLRGTDASVLSAYFSSFTARDIASGTLDLDLSYDLGGNMLTIASAVSVKNLRLGAPPLVTDSRDLPLDLTVALLTDQFGQISFELPVQRHVPDFAAIPETIGEAITDFISEVSADPFELLADLAEVEETALDRVAFDPGSAAITPVAQQQISALVEALTRRPGLGLRAMSNDASGADRAALARRQVLLQVTLATSARPPGGESEGVQLDFADPKVRVVLDEFASARFDATKLAALKTGEQANNEAGVTKGSPASDEYYAAVFEALVAQESVSDIALQRLARYRPQSVVERLASLGIERSRLRVGKRITAGETDDRTVVLELLARAAPGDAADPQAGDVM